MFFEVKNIKPFFNEKLRTWEICSNQENLRTIEAQPKITGSYKKKCVCEQNPAEIITEKPHLI